jgi:hypothetical protein
MYGRRHMVAVQLPSGVPIRPGQLPLPTYHGWGARPPYYYQAWPHQYTQLSRPVVYYRPDEEDEDYYWSDSDYYYDYEDDDEDW